MTRTTRRWALISAALTLVMAPSVWAQPASAPTSQPATSQPTTSQPPTSQPTTQPASQPTSVPTSGFDHNHSAWNAIVSTYVSDGTVNYSGLMANAGHMALLDQYIASLAEADLSDWSNEQKLAFWTNAYNALVVDAVTQHWPVDSVLNVDGFFDGIQYRVAGEAMTLNALEDHVRETFEDPRIHFAFVCAAQSCPPLRSEAYVAARLEEQYEDQTTNFVRASTVLDPDNRAIHVSKIFEWFNRDFSPSGGHRAFIARYIAERDVGTVRATVNFFQFSDYDWSLNGH